VLYQGWHTKKTAADGKSYIVYEIMSSRGDGEDREEFQANRRYSDFVQLKQDLKSETRLPRRFPIRNLLSVEIREQDKMERQNLLQVQMII
jgi:hypothetical protein